MSQDRCNSVTAAAASSPIRRSLAADAPGATQPTQPTPPTVDPDAFDGGLVKRAEKLLKQVGFNPGRVDRVFSANTQEAVRSFQQAVGLDPTGNLDVRTMNALRRAARQDKRGVMAPGQQSEQIKKVEKRLQRLGHDVGQVDGVYDQDTARAVRAFKRDEGMKGSHVKRGLIGKEGRRELQRENDRLNHRVYRARVNPSAERRRDDARVERALDRHGEIKRGDESKSVGVIQRHLRAAGFNPQHTNGRFDDRTEGMVREFQKKSGLEPTGVVNEATWRKLKAVTMETRKDAAPKQAIGERSDEVRRTEKMLKKLGHNPGRVDGIYTEQTERAADRFRNKHDMDPANGIGEGALRKIRKAYKKKVSPFGKSRQVTAYTNGEPRTIRVVKLGDELVEINTAKAFLKMERAARRDGVEINIVSGFRTMAEQRYLYNGWVNRLPGFNPAAPPGYSNHQNGIALDLNTTGPSDAVGSGPVYNWLARNAARFGFRRIPSEHWHWEFRR